MKLGLSSRIAAVFVVFTGLCMSQTLRVSKVAERESDDTERMVPKSKESGQVVFVNKAVEISDEDVESVDVSPHQAGTLDVKLTEEGGKKFTELTQHLRHGQDRIAIIVEGRLMTAPIVRMTLGSHFQLTGFDDLTAEQLLAVAAKISARSPVVPRK